MKAKIIMLAVATMLLGVPVANATIVDISVTTDKAMYLLGEYVTIFVTAYNPNLEPVTLTFGSTMQASYLMDGIYDWKDHHGAYPVITEQEIEPYNTNTWTLVHGAEEMGTYLPTFGSHTIVGEILGYGQSAPVEFEVVPEPISLLLLAMGILGVRAGKYKS